MASNVLKLGNAGEFELIAENGASTRSILKGLATGRLTWRDSDVITASTFPPLATVATSGKYTDLTDRPGTSASSATVSTNNPAVITLVYRNGSSWYRVWSDGWIEQGGYVANSKGTTVTFLKPFSNTDYTIAVTAIGSSGGYAYRIPAFVGSRTSSSFVFSAENRNTGTWYACGV